MRIIGDTHGRISDYLKLTAEADQSIQIGDMGIGFPHITLPPSSDHKFFRGNHDSPQVCRVHPNYLGDWGYDADKGLFWFAGADSIDKHLRREGVSWWRDEELSIAEFERALEMYEQVRPRVVLSHDGPQEFIRAAFGIDDRSRTRQALQAAYELWQPSFWLFGHHHLRREFQSPEGTLFMCLPELGWVDIPLPLPLWGDEEPVLGPWRTEEDQQREDKEMLDRVQSAVQGALDMDRDRSVLFARLCLQNGGKLSKRKRERFFDELTDEMVRRAELAAEKAKQDFDIERAVSIITAAAIKQ